MGRWCRGEISTRDAGDGPPALRGSVTDDPYVDLASGVLHNRLGTADPVNLRQVEAGLTSRFAGYPKAVTWTTCVTFIARPPATCTPGLVRFAPLAIARTDLFCVPQHVGSYAITSRRSTRSIRSAKATAVPRGRSANSVGPLAGVWTGPHWILPPTKRPQYRHCAGTASRCAIF